MTYQLKLVDPDDLEKPLPIDEAVRGFRAAYPNVRIDEAVEDLTRIVIPQEGNLSLFANHDQVWTTYKSQSHVEAVARAAQKLDRVVLGQLGERWEYDPQRDVVEEGVFFTKVEAAQKSWQAFADENKLTKWYWLRMASVLIITSLAILQRDTIADWYSWILEALNRALR